MAKRRTKILLADDQELFVASLRYVIEGIAPDLEIVGIAKDGLEAVRLTRECSPEIILMDVRMPRMDGVEATREILRELPDVRIVMLTTFKDDTYVRHALRFGAVGYLLKNMPPEELVSAIRAVRMGATMFSDEVTQLLVGPEVVAEDELAETLSTLSRREHAVLDLMMQLYNNKQIAAELGVGEQTVRNYVSAIYAKFEIFDRMQLIQALRRVFTQEPNDT